MCSRSIPSLHNEKLFQPVTVLQDPLRSLPLSLEFRAVIVFPEITLNYGNYHYGNYVGNAPVGKVITLKT